MLLLGSIPFNSWGWFQAHFNSILGLFESYFTCLRLFHRNHWTIHDEVKQTFCLPLDRIAWNLTNELVWYLFFLLPRWCLRYIRGGRLGQRKVFACLRRFMVTISFLFKTSLHVPPVCFVFFPLMGRFFDHSSSLMSNFKKRWWIQSRYHSSPTHDVSYSFGRHCCCRVVIAPLSCKPCPSTYF